MSKRKREKMKSKEKRHETVKGDEKTKGNENNKLSEGLSIHDPKERKVVKSGRDLLPNLKDASPEWQQFVKSMSKAMK